MCNAVTIHVCPSTGSDTAPGTARKPVAGLAAALRTRRQHQGPANVKAQALIRAGLSVEIADEPGTVAIVYKRTK